MYQMLIDKIKVISIVFFNLVFILICDLLKLHTYLFLEGIIFN